jgi:hypothetical protein
MAIGNASEGLRFGKREPRSRAFALPPELYAARLQLRQWIRLPAAPPAPEFHAAGPRRLPAAGAPPAAPPARSQLRRSARPQLRRPPELLALAVT